MNANSQNAKAGKILLIDDEAGILITLSRVLQTAGYETQTAANGRDGLAFFQRESFDLILVDRSMPEMNGEEVAAAIRHVAPSMPIILITGFPAAVRRPELFTAILGKPFPRAELLQSMAQALSRRNDEKGIQATTTLGGSVAAPPATVDETFPLPNPQTQGASCWKGPSDNPCLGFA
jgi:DNA-binding NtrC family response regulator